MRLCLPAHSPVGSCHMYACVCVGERDRYSVRERERVLFRCCFLNAFMSISALAH